ncbi:MAG TPA: mechanosensitive ion channel family protein, partial [Aquabacterium sp.]|nr:mechanosensitive ion channel family protein [Aquabacterium sp.]
MNIDTIVTFVTTQGADFGLKILGALAAWIVGRWLIGLVLRGVGAALERGRKVDATLANYLRSILSVVLNVVLVLAILDIFGVKTTSFAALLAGAG